MSGVRDPQVRTHHGDLWHGLFATVFVAAVMLVACLLVIYAARGFRAGFTERRVCHVALYRDGSWRATDWDAGHGVPDCDIRGTVK